MEKLPDYLNIRYSVDDEKGKEIQKPGHQSIAKELADTVVGHG